MKKRKKWTAIEEVTEDLVKSRERKKWQLAFRRYVLEKNLSLAYAPFFGLDIENYRKWIELQFQPGINWDNFGKVWQFEHIVPINYFDFTDNKDLIICWNFINMQVVSAEVGLVPRIDLINARPYFENLFNKTGYTICKKMLDKISHIQASSQQPSVELEKFIIERKSTLEILTDLPAEAFRDLNQGVSLEQVLMEKAISQKFG